MKILALVLCFFAACQAVDECDPGKCKRPNCVCSSLEPPISNLPQLVKLSFDDAAAKYPIFDDFWKPLLFNRKNPDGCHIGGTFFVPHEYSDYEVVNTLYNQGFEIGSHSITKDPLMSYWQNITKEGIIQEMGGQKTIISHFANIPEKDIVGARIPLLQINKNIFNGLKEAKFTYDNSWATLNKNPFFPHTLDYKSDMDCFNELCQPNSVAGFWENPLIDWKDMNGIDCNKLFGCQFHGTPDEIFNWMKTEFLKTYNGNRAPFSLSINYAVFSYVVNSREGLTKFLDYLTKLKDVYLVNEIQVIEWMKKPVPKEKFNSCVKRPAAPCHPVTCVLKKGPEETRYMRSCVSCPKKYPWLGNPLGK